MEDRPLSFVFSGLYHLSTLNNCLVSNFLIWLGNSVSFSFGFRQPLSNRERMELGSHIP